MRAASSSPHTDGSSGTNERHVRRRRATSSNSFFRKVLLKCVVLIKHRRATNECQPAAGLSAAGSSCGTNRKLKSEQSNASVRMCERSGTGWCRVRTEYSRGAVCAARGKPRAPRASVSRDNSDGQKKVATCHLGNSPRGFNRTSTCV